MDARKVFEIEAENNSWSHAYLVVGDEVEIEPLVNYIIEQKNIDKSDIETVRPEKLSGKAGEIKVDDIRECLRKMSLTPVGETKLAIIYSSEKLNQSSGNILLKSLEEPDNNSIFILVAGKDSVLPTIRSRCRTVLLPNKIKKSSGEFIDEFKKGFFKASQLIEKVVKEEQTDELLDELLDYFHERLLLHKKIEDKECLALVEEARGDIAANANAKLVLENLFLKIEDYL